MKSNEDQLFQDLPRGVAISWGKVEAPRRGPKREMDVQTIVATAIEIADKDGLAAVSMNRVAAAFGFTAMSLYRYIPSKEDLLLLMQDAVCAMVELPVIDDYEDWRGNMRVYVHASIQVLRDHPWYSDIPISGIPIMPNILKMVDWSLRTMRYLPLNGNEKMAVTLLLSNYARGCGTLQRDIDRAMLAGVSPESFSGLQYTQALKLLVKAEQYPDLQPIVMSGIYTEDGQNAEEKIDDMEFGLERILDGIEQYLNSKQ
ncbi:TetR/AcrR family transcriptional regulator [Paenibacillus sp. GCM10027626]|uniref:TetR/AcrR family transcriptional regulator n=1 Tax=Paenibacillus sp. GCM10027626 TaxID=3273411 RepID=UPI00362903BB